MRLSEKEISSIKKNILRFDPLAKIYLFGSRVDDNKSGGDIDILIISDSIGFLDKVRIRTAIFNEIEEQKLDLIVKQNFDDLFVKIIEPDLQCL